MKPYLAQKVQKFGRKLGFRLIFKDPILGMKRILLPVEYIRFAENEYVLKQLNLKESTQILDIGSPKMTGLFIGTVVGKCFLTDISSYFVKNINKEISILSSDKYIVDVQDARNLKYDNNSFDSVYSISVIEHIPENGDTVAIKEMARVLKPSGRLCITVPHDDGGYEEIFKKRNDPTVYWINNTNTDSIFYYRNYDYKTLHERLIRPSGLQLKDLTYYGEIKFAAEKFLINRPMWQRLWLFPFHEWFAKTYLEEVGLEISTYKKVACLTFEK